LRPGSKEVNGAMRGTLPAIRLQLARSSSVERSSGGRPGVGGKRGIVAASATQKGIKMYKRILYDYHVLITSRKGSERSAFDAKLDSDGRTWGGWGEATRLRDFSARGLPALVRGVHDDETLVRHHHAGLGVRGDRVLVGAAVTQELGELQHLAPVLVGRRPVGARMEPVHGENTAHVPIISRSRPSSQFEWCVCAPVTIGSRDPEGAISGPCRVSKYGTRKGIAGQVVLCLVVGEARTDSRGRGGRPRVPRTWPSGTRSDQPPRPPPPGGGGPRAPMAPGVLHPRGSLASPVPRSSFKGKGIGQVPRKSGVSGVKP